MSGDSLLINMFNTIESIVRADLNIIDIYFYIAQTASFKYKLTLNP